MATTKRIFIMFMLVCCGFVSSFAQVVRIAVDGSIAPGSADYINRSIEYAESIKAKAIVLELNTPGGLLDATRDIVQSIMSSKVPFVVYISPSGSRAGSAGVFITLASHVAAMAPGTNIGAAHPVGAGGESPDSIMNEKITNDAAAFIRSIADRRNKNIDWAERTVRESISSTENEALLAGSIDFIAPNFNELLKLIHNKSVQTKSGYVIIKTASEPIINKEMNWREEFLFWLSDPNIAYILLMIGIYGLMFEFWSPGAIFPGVAGGISLLLAAYSLQMMPVNYIGLLLILLAVVMFLLEIKVTSYGLLTIGGVVSLSFGSVMLIDTPYEFMDISMSLIISMVILTSLFFAALIGFGVKAQFRKTAVGQESFVGSKGIAISSISTGKSGQVRVFGEIWNASAESDIEEGDEIEVTNISKFTLKVKKSV